MASLCSELGHEHVDILLTVSFRVCNIYLRVVLMWYRSWFLKVNALNNPGKKLKAAI